MGMVQSNMARRHFMVCVGSFRQILG